MNKIILMLGLAAAASTMSYADALTPEEAWARAINSPAKIISKHSTDEATLVDTKTVNGQPAAYVFNTQSGFAVLSADDNCLPVLGYSEDGNIDPANMPKALQYWLDEYANQIAYARVNGIEMAKAPSSFAKISPIVKTRWNQSAPYNAACPEFNGQNCVTGCVATAMSQIMKVHNYPASGTGSVEYEVPGIQQTLSADFADFHFAWDDMLNVYNADATEAQIDAVAQLMKATGYSVQMNYSLYSSYTSTFNATEALVNNFGYAKDMRFMERAYYTNSEWEEYIYSELSAGRPVIYSGQPAPNYLGHTFICDGYNNGYYHINWGWGGLSDGYFLLTALNPPTQGVGGGGNGYSSEQSIIANIKPANGETEIWVNVAVDQFNIEGTYSLGDNIRLERFHNYSIAEVTGCKALKLTPENGGDPQIIKGRNITLKPFASILPSSLTLPKSVPDGTYIVTPGFITDDDMWHDVHVNVNSPQFCTMTVVNNSVEVEPAPVAELVFTDIEHTPIYWNNSDARSFSVTATVNNQTAGDFYGLVHVNFCDADDDIILFGQEMTFGIGPNETKDFVYESVITLVNGKSVNADQEYYMYVANVQNVPLSDKVAVNIIVEEEQTSMSFSKPYAADNGSLNAINPFDMNFLCDVKCGGGIFTGQLSLLLFDYATQDHVYTMHSNFMSLAAGESTVAQFHGNFEAAEPNTKYFLVPFYGNQQVQNPQVITTIDFEAGINSIKVDEKDAKYYTPQGILVPSSSLAPGLYIRVTPSSTSKVLIK